jgi:hypothetical protein
VSENESYNIGSRVIDHASCVQGASGVWYPNFGQGVEIFGWAHDHAPRQLQHADGTVLTIHPNGTGTTNRRGREGFVSAGNVRIALEDPTWSRIEQQWEVTA